MNTPEQTIKLEKLKGLAYKIAKAVIQREGAYYCMLDGKRTKVEA